MDNRKSELLHKSDIILKVKRKLKKDYVGIDKQIDELIDYIEPWYIFNEIQNKPIVVNLWGMTAVGKTSLIQKMFKYLDLENCLYRFDVRTLLDSDKISTKMGVLSEHNKNKIGIIFDEFQNARTIDENGIEETKSGLRGLWDLLDSGKIEMSSVGFSARRIYFAYNALRGVVENGVKIKNGIVQNKIKYTKNKLTYDKFNELVNKLHIGNFLSDSFYDIKNDLPEYMSYDNICNLMSELNEKEILEFYEKVLDKLSKPKIYDFTRSIIFIIGNLDEVYTSHDNFNPDMDANMLHKLSNKISITDVKLALTRRFRSEQIARLGNNHLIYSTLDVNSFEKIIKDELRNINKDIYSKYNIKFIFKNSVKDILYKESVFPTQGARPVFNRVSSIIRPVISKIMKKIYEDDINLKSNKIVWEYKDKKHYLTDIDSNYLDSFDFNLQMGELRESKNDDSQCKTAVHEAGHAVISIVDLKIIPRNIYSRTADATSKGFCSIDLPDDRTRDFYNNYIKVCLGGYVAEIIVFGKNNLSDGCYGDFKSSTNLSSKMVKLYGMYDLPIITTSHNSPMENLNVYKDSSDGSDDNVREIILSNLKLTENTLNKYKKLLYEISKYLSTNSNINQKKLIKIITKVNPELLDDIKPKKHYFGFKEKYNKFFEK